MRVRTYLGLLLAVLSVALASYLTQQNRELFQQPFRLGPELSVPLSSALLLVFIAGFLPAVTGLLVQTLQRDLQLRRERRAGREVESLEAAYRRAIDFQADGQCAKAAAELATYVAARPHDFPALLRYGEVLRHLGRKEEALETLRRASGLFPQSVALLYQLAAGHEARGEAEVAREIQARILRDFPGFGLQVLRRQRGDAIAQRKWREALALEERVMALLGEGGDPGDVEREAGIRQGLDYQRGVVLLEEEKVEEAVAVFRELLDREPRLIPAQIMLGEAELLRDREEAALAEWRHGYETTGSPVFLQRIEDHLIERQQPVRAIETLRALIASARNDLLPRFFLGRLYHRLEMPDEALKQLDGLRDRIRSSPTYHYLLARIHERRGEMRRAVESYLACLQQLGLGSAEYLCRVCRERYPDWRDRCDHCGSWNSVELNFEEEHLTAEDLGVRHVPVWGSAVDSGAFVLPDSGGEK